MKLFFLGCKDSLIQLLNSSVISFYIPVNASQLADNSTAGETFHNQSHNVWCFNDSVASYLEINLTTLYQICAIETQGVQTSSNETKYVSSYLLEAFVEVSANCSEWKFYNRTGNITVSFLLIAHTCYGEGVYRQLFWLHCNDFFNIVFKLAAVKRLFNCKAKVTVFPITLMEYFRVVTKYMVSGIKGVGLGITREGSGITALRSDHRIGISSICRDQESGCIQYLLDREPTLVTLLESRIRNLHTKMGSALTKHTLSLP